MKVVAFNGSPKKEGNTYHALRMVADELEKEGIPLTYGTSRVHLDRPQNA